MDLSLSYSTRAQPLLLRKYDVMRLLPWPCTQQELCRTWAVPLQTRRVHSWALGHHSNLIVRVRAWEPDNGGKVSLVPRLALG